MQGRGNIEEYNTLGYVPIDASAEGGPPDIAHRTVSRTVEYAYDDFAIALFARAARNRSVYDKYIARSQNWKKSLDERVERTTYKSHGTLSI